MEFALIVLGPILSWAVLIIGYIVAGIITRDWLHVFRDPEGRFIFGGWLIFTILFTWGALYVMFTNP